MLARSRPEIVHTHLNPAARRIGAIAQRLRIPHVMTLHLDYDANEHASIDGWWRSIPSNASRSRPTLPAR